MFFISKKKFEEKVAEEVNKRYTSEPHILIFEVEVADMPKEEMEAYLEKVKAKFKEKLGNENFVVVPTNNGRGHINVTYIA